MAESSSPPAAGKPLVETSWLDRAVGYFSPQAGLQRLRYRTALAMAGAHVGASDRRAFRSLNTSNGSADADVNPDLAELRKRSRALERNSPLASGVLGSNATHVVGTGIGLHPQIRRDVLGLSQEEARRWERKTASWWSAWFDSQACDVTRTQTGPELQDLVFRSTDLNGDCFTLRRFRPRAGEPFGLKIQVIEGDRVDNPNNRWDSDTLRGGVEIDGDGAPAGYWIADRHPGDVPGVPFARWTRVPAFDGAGQRLVLHHYHRRRPGQSRGRPILAPVLELLTQISRYTETEIDAAVVASLFTVFIKTESGEGADWTGDDDEIAAGGSEPSDALRLGSGLVADLAEGESIDVADPKRPNSNFDPFLLACCRWLGVALEIPYEVVVKHFQSSYSAARAALLEAWTTWRTRRVWLERTFCRPVYRWWMFEAVARGYIDAPGFMESEVLRQAWLGARWIGPAAGQINPDVETRAAKERVDARLSTRTAETAQITGGDFEADEEQRAYEEQLIAGHSTPAPPAPSPASPSTPPPPVLPDPDEADQREAREE